MTLEQEMQALCDRHGIPAFCFVYLGKDGPGAWHRNAPAKVKCLSGSKFPTPNLQAAEHLEDGAMIVFLKWLAGQEIAGKEPR